MQKKIKNILIINPFGIGDVLFTAPLIDSLGSLPDGPRIGFLCNRRTEPLIRANPAIEWVFVYEKDELRALRKKSLISYIKKIFSMINDIRGNGFDAAIDLSLNREYGFLCWLAGIKERVGFNYKNRGTFLTKKIDISGYHDRHIVEYYLGLLRFIGVRPQEKIIRLDIPGAAKEWANNFLKAARIKEGELIIGIAPAGGASWGSQAPAKHWSSEGFAVVADNLIKKLGAKVVILGSVSEAGVCEKMVKSMKNPAILACGKTSVLESAALISSCALVIANDGGPLHMAVAVGVRTVGIFGPVDERVYGQYPAGERHKVVKNDIICRPCYRNFKLKECVDRKCLDGISTEGVVKAAEEALAAG